MWLEKKITFKTIEVLLRQPLLKDGIPEQNEIQSWTNNHPGTFPLEGICQLNDTEQKPTSKQFW